MCKKKYFYVLYICTPVYLKISDNEKMNLNINNNFITPQFKSSKIKNNVSINYNKIDNSIKKINKPNKKNKNFNKKISSALFLFTLTSACAFLFVKNQKKPVFLSSEINFTPSKTMEEAIEFAKNKLKISDYYLNDLDCANYVNESIVQFNNLSKDKKRIIDIVVPLQNNYLTASMGHGLFKRVLFINENMLKKELKPSQNDLGLIKTALLSPEIQLSENQKEIFEKVLRGSEKLSISEKVRANFYLTQLELFFSKMFSRTRKQNEKTKISECSKFHVCFHEIGHELHRNNVGKKLFKQYNYYGKDPSALSLLMAKERFKEELGSENFARIVKNVSYYAAISPDEFVAEVFSGILGGIKYDDKIMELFKKYGGVLPF